MDSCIFCKIIDKELPSAWVYEDDNTFAFLTTGPDNMGHTLVVPKRHYKNIYEMPDEELAHLALSVKKVSIAVKKAMGATGINITMNNDATAGQAVFHAHMHVIPRHEGDGLESWKGKRDYKEGEKEQIAEKIRSGLIA